MQGFNRQGSPQGWIASPGVLSFQDGATTFFRGLGFIVSRPSVWLYAAVPVVSACVITIALAVGGIWEAHHLIDARYPELDDWMDMLEYGGVLLFYDAMVLVGALILGSSLAQLLSGPALDAIVRAQETALGRAPSEGAPFLESLWRSLKITVITLVLGLPVIAGLTVVEFLFPPAALVTLPAKLVYASALAAWNLLDYPFALRRMNFDARYTFYKAHFASCLGFGLPMTLIGMIPVLGLVMLPAGVAGATRLLIDCEIRGNQAVFRG